MTKPTETCIGTRQVHNDAFSLIGDALLAITESNVYRGNDDSAHAEDALAFAVNLLVEARDLLRAPAAA